MVLTSWSDLCRIVCSSSSPESCKLGLQQTGESLQLLSSHYLELRCASEQTLYSLLSKEYVPLIGKFIELLCIAMVTKWNKAIAEDTAKPPEDENELVHCRYFGWGCGQGETIIAEQAENLDQIVIKCYRKL